MNVAGHNVNVCKTQTHLVRIITRHMHHEFVCDFLFVISSIIQMRMGLEQEKARHTLNVFKSLGICVYAIELLFWSKRCYLVYIYYTYVIIYCILQRASARI